MIRFEDPWMLLSLPAVAAWIVLRYRGRGAAAVRFSSVHPAVAAGASWRQRLMWLGPCLQALAMTALAVALARPQTGFRRVRSMHQGVAIEMLMDISSSMTISMTAAGGANRLEVAKGVFERFVAGDGAALGGRANDLIGMVTFARYADTVCPMTLAHDALLHYVRNLKIEERPGEDGTAIGDALALAAARLKSVEDVARRQARDGDEDYDIKSKVIILLTDGENNSGRHLPLEGAALARKWGVRVHIIGFGDRRDTITVDTPGGAVQAPGALGGDAATLARAADSTGGIFRMAHDADSLRAVYEEIDRLETSEIRSLSFLEYREGYWPLALAAAVMIALDIVLRSTLLRKIP